jgi:hypothetical protein
MRLAAALREAGLPHQALAELRRVQRGRPGLLEASVQLGVVLYSLGRASDAVAQWRRVLAADPARRDARMYLKLVPEPAPDTGSGRLPPGRSPAGQPPPGDR